MKPGEAQIAGSKLLQVWDTENDPALWSTADPKSETYRSFMRDLIERKVETDAIKLLQRSTTANNLRVLQSASEWIKPAGCLEKLLYAYQHERVDTLTVRMPAASFGEFRTKAEDGAK